LKTADKFLVASFFILAAFLHSNAQMSIVGNSDAAALAREMLGNGISVTNASLNCGNNASASFSYMGSNMEIGQGIILTTGRATDAGFAGAYFCNVSNGNNFSDPDLVSISPKAKYDGCVLEFDFVPFCDTARLSYIFGSEEYPQGEYHSYNDAFAIFITGPNPAGGNYASKNIATLPNGTTPVSIDSINDGNPTPSNASHPEYFRVNYINPVSDIAYNGYTKLITSKVPLVSCGAYHLKIAIADGGNELYDSGVFIQAGSFVCETAPLASVFVATTCVGSATLSAAVSGFTGNPSYVWLPGGQHTPTITASAGDYTCMVSVPGVCAAYTLNASVPAVDSMSVLSHSFVICKGGQVKLQASGADSFSWSPAGSLSNPFIFQPVAFPDAFTVYTVTGFSGACSSQAQVTVQVVDLPQAGFTASTYDTDIENGPVQFYGTGASPAQFNWDFGDGSGGSGKDPLHTYQAAGIFEVSLTVTGENNCSSTFTRTIVIRDSLGSMFTFYAPSAFTPNGDGRDEVFMPVGNGWKENSYVFEVFDRWGSLLFSTSQPLHGWDGTVKRTGNLAKQDIYVWKAQVSDEQGKEHVYTGTVALFQ
jgi:gliding motility-associated-like protein